jgi:hypothetical protein
MRLEKVSVLHPAQYSLINYCKQWKKQETRYTDRPWSAEEIAVFEETILAQKRHGAELRAVMDRLVTRSMPGIVRFYGHWKK